jgi:hypothetical protein
VRTLKRVTVALAFSGVIMISPAAPVQARQRYKHNLERFYGDLLPKQLDACTTCHLSRADVADPALFEKKPPHNPFGARLRVLGEERRAAGKDATFYARLRAAADEDSDSDGVANEIEILSGHAPGNPADRPADSEIAAAIGKRDELRRLHGSYAWQPYQPVVRPDVPSVRSASWVRNPIDAFIAAEHDARALTPRPEAPRSVLLRRVSLDLTGLAPTPEELQSFLADASPDAYEKVVERLLSSPRHGERWGRHWMDVWRYSDWAGWGEQVRDSQPHIWRWRDWIVESLNADKGYDRMLTEMLAGDELAPGDPQTLRATGYLVRSFKLLSREAWMQECVDHATQAFLGLTFGCARCHDHMYDPITQREYYEMRAFFEPYNVRLDRVPGQADTAKDGLPRVFDASLDAPTYLFLRGDDRNPDKENPLAPHVPRVFGETDLKLAPVGLPMTAFAPDKKDYVIAETISASEKAVLAAKSAHQAAVLKSLPKPAADGGGGGDGDVSLAEMAVLAAEARHEALLAVLRVEKLDDSGSKERDPEAWKKAATDTTSAQRWARLLEARRGARVARDAATRADAAAAKAAPDASKKAQGEAAQAKEALAKAEKELADAQQAALLPPSTEYTKRDMKVYPASSTGRRLALAGWLTERRNPLVARVAANHIWLRHFGQAIAPSVNDLGLNGRPPSHPALLDWLAAELMEPTTEAAQPWSMKHIHRLIVTSATYRMASTPDDADLAADPDDVWLWRMPSRRLEAEAVRDNVLGVAGRLDESMGGPELDYKLILTTRRRSLYYRHAAEKQAELLKIFDMAGVSECYERKTSVVPQQALALANSELVLTQARLLARALVPGGGEPDPASFARAAFERVLSRSATDAEVSEAVRFLDDEQAFFSREKGRLTVAAADASDASKPSADPALRAREDLVHALLNHNDFVTVR